MGWIGIECSVEAWELRRWADHVGRSGGARVADLLERCARLVAGETVGVAGADRMLEIESRAAAAVARMHAEASAKASAIVGRLMGEGANPVDVMKAAGMDGWRAGSAAGGKNGGVNARRRKYPRGHAAQGVTAERGEAALSVESTIARDRRYGESWAGWAGVEMRKDGFKMARVARGLDMDVTEAWRHVSGWAKHWRREALHGRAFPGPQAGWCEKLKEARDRAMNVGVKGRRPVNNGSGDFGQDRETET
jgi:hypothetical protein